ncbi:MAG: hypothetical protein H6548_00450 [Chitinophagales bacterium]|nr:hypothetical protein [Chitinophagales bacterium]HAE14775.1 hypothetical protein [Bacteroidota bacterium]MCB9019316.1 hypothetical protein [Chitinophagales bacterium]MCB9020567.1 hypothetical protein [Chitinophagales bacterium]HPE97061.1 hypothetical protein [Chitinophagales bacterium]
MYLHEEGKNDPLSSEPLQQKAMEILRLVRALHDAAQADDTDLTEDTELMMEREALDILMGNALLIPGKIRANIQVEAYWLRMENAVLIKRAAMEIQSMVHQLLFRHPDWQDYADMIIEEVEQFRGLFINWVGRFDSSIDPDDGWGLFDRNT